jgi:hypothetical protein
MSHLLDRLNFLQSKTEQFRTHHGQVTRETAIGKTPPEPLA